MPYANIGGGSTQPLTPAQALALKSKKKAQKEGKSIRHMINLVNEV